MEKLFVHFLLPKRLFKRRSFSHLRVVIFPALNYTECYPKQIQKWVDCPRGKQRITRLDKEVNTSEVASLAEWDWAGMRDEFCTALGNPQPGRPPLAPDYLPSVSSQWSTPVRDGLSSVRVSQHALVVALTSPGRLLVLVDRSSPVSGTPVSSEHVPLVL